MANPHSPEDLASISTFIHNLIGWVLLVLAAVNVREQRRGLGAGRARFVWPVLGMVIGFGLLSYIVLHQTLTHRVSPFADPVQLQHELIGLVGGVGATIELVRRSGRFRAPQWEAAWPLALAGIGVIFVAHEQGNVEALVVHWFLAAALSLAGLAQVAAVLSGEPARALRVFGTLLLFCAALQLVAYKEKPGAHNHPGQGAAPAAGPHASHGGAP